MNVLCTLTLMRLHFLFYKNKECISLKTLSGTNIEKKGYQTPRGLEIIKRSFFSK